MANKIQATMSTEIALDTLQAGNSIKRLTQLVSSATSAWKAQEAQLKSAGATSCNHSNMSATEGLAAEACRTAPTPIEPACCP